MKRFRSALIVILSVFFFSSTPPNPLPQGKGYAITKVVIDPGHGGHDPGCSGSSAKEKEVALAISLRLGKLIEETFRDVKVIYTRKTDEFVELHERAAIANNNKADLFICIHCNAGKKDVSVGSETYVMGLHRSQDNLNVSKRENSSVLLEKDYQAKYDGFDPNSPEANIIFSLYQNAFLEQSVKFASYIQKHFREGAGRSDRGVKQAGFLVLYKTTMPSVLIETGFLTHADEEKFLGSSEGQDKVAQAIFHAFRDYKLEMETGSAPRRGAEKPKEKDQPKETKEKKTEIKKDTAASAPEKRDKDTLVAVSPERDTATATPVAGDPVIPADSVAKKTAPADTVREEVIKPRETEMRDTATVALHTPKKEPDAVPVKTNPDTASGASLYFSVQIATSSVALDPGHERLKKAGQPVFSEKTPEGIIKYMTGKYPEFEKAVELQKQLRAGAYPDAFVVAYKDGKRIPIKDAIALIKKK